MIELNYCEYHLFTRRKLHFNACKAVFTSFIHINYVQSLPLPTNLFFVYFRLLSPT